VQPLHWLYDAAWFSGTLTSGLVYGVWMWRERHASTATVQ
jgi:cytosine/uracil/thiamine/allantoin permease